MTLGRGDFGVVALLLINADAKFKSAAAASLLSARCRGTLFAAAATEATVCAGASSVMIESSSAALGGLVCSSFMLSEAEAEEEEEEGEAQAEEQEGLVAVDEGDATTAAVWRLRNGFVLGFRRGGGSDEELAGAGTAGLS